MPIFAYESHILLTPSYVNTSTHDTSPIRRDRFLGRGAEFDALAETVELASADFVLEAVDDVSAVMDVLQARRKREGYRRVPSVLVLWLCPPPRTRG